VEHFNRRALKLALNTIKRTVNDTLSSGLFAVQHQVVHKLGEHMIAKFGVRQDLTFFGAMAS